MVWESGLYLRDFPATTQYFITALLILLYIEIAQSLHLLQISIELYNSYQKVHVQLLNCWVDALVLKSISCPSCLIKLARIS